jgi:hypothetical protein
MDTDQEAAWYGENGLLLWFKKWFTTYKDGLVEAYEKINQELVPTRQYERALVWCMYIFDLTIFTHQMVSMVRETENQTIQSAYYIDNMRLIEILQRLENQMNQCRATFDELLTVDAIDRLYVALTTDKQPQSGDKHCSKGKALEKYEAELQSLMKRASRVDTDSNTDQPPVGVYSYTPDSDQADLMRKIIEFKGDIDPQITELAMSLEILRASSDRDAVHAANLHERLPPSLVRDIKLIAVPGDAPMARQITESYLALLDETIDNVRVYRMNYGELLSKWKGESEKNFERIMRWMVDKARENAVEGRSFDVLWMDDVHVLMSQRTESGGEDYLNVIKTTMLQIMDIFNKDKRLSRFALLFSTGTEQLEIDAAFRRRIDSIYEIKQLEKSPAFKEILINHMLYTLKMNVEGDALERLRRVTKMSALKRLVYAYYVHVRFIIGTEFYIASYGTNGYSLREHKPYFNLNGHIVFSSENIKQVIEKGDGPRLFYRPGEVDGRNLSQDNAGFAVYVLYTDPTHNDI